MRLAPVLTLAVAASLMSGCAGDEPSVALLVADGSSAYAVDTDAFEERVRDICEECSVTVYDAGGDAAEQRSQARQAEAESADVLVVVPVVPEELESLTGGDVPLVSLGTLVPGADRHVGLVGEDLDADEPQPGSDLDAARELILGDRSSMTYVPTVEMSRQAADVSGALLEGSPVPGGEEVEGVESWTYETQEITLDSLTTVLVGQGILTIDELCEGETATRCAGLGLR